MGRGLSQQQHDILAALPQLSDGMTCGDVPTARELVALIGLELTPSNRASVSRAISRLQARGLILHLWGYHKGYRQRTGYARATPEQVKAREERKQALSAKSSAS